MNRLETIEALKREVDWFNRMSKKWREAEPSNDYEKGFYDARVTTYEVTASHIQKIIDKLEEDL